MSDQAIAAEIRGLRKDLRRFAEVMAACAQVQAAGARDGGVMATGNTSDLVDFQVEHLNSTLAELVGAGWV